MPVSYETDQDIDTYNNKRGNASPQTEHGLCKSRKNQAINMKTRNINKVGWGQLSVKELGQLSHNRISFS